MTSLFLVERDLAPTAAPTAASGRRTLAEELPGLVLPFGLLLTAGASVGLLLPTLALKQPMPFFTRNDGPTGLLSRKDMLLALLLGAAFAGLLSVLYLLMQRDRRVEVFRRTADLLSPLCLAGLMPTLFEHRAWYDNALNYLIFLGVFALLAEQLFSRFFRAWSEISSTGGTVAWRRWAERWLPATLVIAGSLAYAGYFSYYTLLNHRRFGTGDFDLGINVNWCFNALRGHPLRTSVLFGADGGSFLANHAIFAMALWLPLFALKPGAEVLLVYQATMCGLAAIPLYGFAKQFIPRPSAALLALAYLMFAPLHGPNFYDFHELPVALPFYFLLFYCIATKRYLWVWPLVVIILAHREDTPIGLAMLGVFLVLTGARPKLGLGLFGVAAGYFALMRFVVMPAHGTWGFDELYKELQVPGGNRGFGGIIQTLLTNPVFVLSTLLREAKLTYALHLFAPLVFLPLRRPSLWLLLLGPALLTLLTTGYGPTLGISFQYTTHWIPYLFAATVLSLHWVAQKGAHRRRGVLTALGIATLSHSTVFGAVIQHNRFQGGFNRIEFQETREEKRRYAEFKRLTESIPAEASVLVSGNLLPHVAARANVYPLNYTIDVDYLLVSNGYQPHQRGVLEETFKRFSFGLVGQYRTSIYLFKRDHVSPDTDRAKHELGIY